jgi:hypothetical protein
VIELLSLGANPRAANVAGDTPLHVAAAAGSFSNVSELIEAGADMTAVNRAGQTPRDVAVGGGHCALSSAENWLGQGRDVGPGWAMPVAGSPDEERSSTGSGSAGRGSMASGGWGRPAVRSPGEGGRGSSWGTACAAPPVGRGGAGATTWEAPGQWPTPGPRRFGPSGCPTGPVTGRTVMSPAPDGRRDEVQVILSQPEVHVVSLGRDHVVLEVWGPHDRPRVRAPGSDGPRLAAPSHTWVLSHSLMGVWDIGDKVTDCTTPVGGKEGRNDRKRRTSPEGLSGKNANNQGSRHDTSQSICSLGNKMLEPHQKEAAALQWPTLSRTRP